MTMSDTVQEVEVQTFEEPALITAAAPVLPKKLTLEERLEIENCFLKVQNIAMQTEKMYADIQRAVTMRQEEQNRMLALQARLGEKYQVDMSKAKIAPDGTITEG